MVWGAEETLAEQHPRRIGGRLGYCAFLIDSEVGNNTWRFRAGCKLLVNGWDCMLRKNEVSAEGVKSSHWVILY